MCKSFRYFKYLDSYPSRATKDVSDRSEIHLQKYTTDLHLLSIMYN